MSGICYGENFGDDLLTIKPVKPGSQLARKRRMEILKLKISNSTKEERRRQRHKVEKSDNPTGLACVNAVPSCTVDDINLPAGPESDNDADSSPSSGIESAETVTDTPKFGMTSVCGRRKDMEDAVSIHPFFSGGNSKSSCDLHFYGVFDGHGCSHVAMKCRDRMHEIVKDELDGGGKNNSWEDRMKRSFSRMDEEVAQWSNMVGISTSSCLCNLRTHQRDTVGSTAVVAVVTPDKIIISSCGDSRAVLGRNGTAVPLFVDHKPDRPDELERIEKAGGRVIDWKGPRVLGVLAMSRAIGDQYLKPYVISEPEVTVIDRTPEDDCLILGTDGLWDVINNTMVCGVARMCLESSKTPSPPSASPGIHDDVKFSGAMESSDRACLDASLLLTKLALARRSTDNISVVVVDLRRT